jgi:hypothetical protein
VKDRFYRSASLALILFIAICLLLLFEGPVILILLFSLFLIPLILFGATNKYKRLYTYQHPEWGFVVILVFP